ncbi:helix-turn-helix transcriptional regulator [Henriciella sp.]|uniref:helix-turn-helix transcriptional regulator n=1 Tax=Henriciella sp. TaxID=1968823 RepID=UPI00261E4181|nr:helix-turn-helix transcriptional regulator [Henriciella sp.]
MADHPDLISHLKDYRQQAGLTQAQLAKRVSVSRKTINTIENGVFVPTTVLALKLARALDCRVEDLFALRDEA